MSGYGGDGEIKSHEPGQGLTHFEHIWKLPDPSAVSSFADEVQQRIDDIMLFPESGAFFNNEYMFEPDVRKTLIGKLND